MRKTALLSFVAFLLSVCFLSVVFAAPGIPHQIYGSVTVNSVLVPDGIGVIAQIQGDTYTAFTKNGKFGYSPDIFYVEDPDGNRAGKTINISVNYKSVKNIVFQNNGYTNLDLEVETICGDNYCLGNENSNTCSADCGAPAPSQNPPSETGGSGGSGGGGGGGGGGGSFVAPSGQICIENWECTYWSDCSNWEQTRQCNDLNACGTERVKPIEQRECSASGTGAGSSVAEEESSGSFFSKIWRGITGRAIGENGSESIGFPWLLLVIILVIIIAFVLIRKRNKA